MKKLAKKLDPRMEQKKDAKYDPWVNSGGTGSGSTTSPPSIRPPTNDYATNYWSTTTATQEGTAEVIRRSSAAKIEYPPSPKGDRTGLSESQQLRLAIELSEKEEAERRRRQQETEQHDADLQYALNVSKRDTTYTPQASAAQRQQDTNPFGPASTGPSLYEQETAFVQQLGDDGYHKIVEKHQDMSELESVFKGDNQKRSMQRYGFADCCKLFGAGDCAVLVCLVCRGLMENRISYDDVEPKFGHQAVDVSGERRALLQWLYENAWNIPEVRDGLLMEAEIHFPHIKNPMELTQQHVTKMAKDQTYLGVAEMAAGPHRDNYILVFVRERPHHMGGGLEIAQIVAPPTAKTVYYTLFSDSGHFDLLRPLPINMSDSSLFAGAPWGLRNDLERLYNEKMGIVAPKVAASSTSARPSVPKLKVDGRSTNPWDDESDDEENDVGTSGSGNPWDAPGSNKTGDMWQQNHTLFDGLTTKSPTTGGKKSLNELATTSGTQSPSGNPLTPQGQQSVNVSEAERQRKVAELQQQLKAMSMGSSIPPQANMQAAMNAQMYGAPYGGGYGQPMQQPMYGAPYGQPMGGMQQPMYGAPQQGMMQPQMNAYTMQGKQQGTGQRGSNGGANPFL